MGSHLDFVQGTVVFPLGMVGAVVYGTGNALVFLICHGAPPSFSAYKSIWLVTNLVSVEEDLLCVGKNVS